MDAAKQYRDTIQKLKKRIRALESKEKEGRKKVRAVMSDARKMVKSAKTRLHAEVRALKSKHTLDKASAYASAAMEMERKFIKAAEEKGKALASAVMKMDKDSVVRLVKDISSKACKSSVAKKVKKKVKR